MSDIEQQENPIINEAPKEPKKILKEVLYEIDDEGSTLDNAVFEILK